MIAVRWFDLLHAISTVAMAMKTVGLIVEWSASVVHRWTGAIERLPWLFSIVFHSRREFGFWVYSFEL